MKRKTTRTILWLTLLGIMVFCSIAGAQTLVWVTDDTPGDPYIMGGGTSFRDPDPGIEIDIYRKVAQNLGLTVTFKRMPWKLCLELIAHDKVDGVFPASFQPERMDIGAYPMHGDLVDDTRKTRDSAYHLYKTADSPLSWDGERFQNVGDALGAPLGWAVVDDLKTLGAAVKEMPMHANIPDMLLQKRLAGFVCLSTVFDVYLKRDPAAYQAIVKVDPPIWKKPYYLLLSKNFTASYPDLAERIWNEIRAIQASEDFAALIAPYME